MTTERSPTRQHGARAQAWLLLITSLASLAIGCQAREVPTREVPKDDPICDQYARLKNAGDPAADKLLAAGPATDVTVVDAADKDAFDAASVLRAPCKILEVHPDKAEPGSGRFVLVLQGNFMTPRVAVCKQGVVEDPSRRNLMNPDVLVEVRDGKIQPIKVGLHKD